MTMMTGSEALVELLRNEGVEYVFGLPGATEVLFLDALEDNPEIKYILGLHETVAVGMAEGYSRTSGKVGVVNLHTGAGRNLFNNVRCNFSRSLPSYCKQDGRRRSDKYLRQRASSVTIARTAYAAALRRLFRNSRHRT